MENMWIVRKHSTSTPDMGNNLMKITLQFSEKIHHVERYKDLSEEPTFLISFTSVKMDTAECYR